MHRAHPSSSPEAQPVTRGLLSKKLEKFAGVLGTEVNQLVAQRLAPLQREIAELHSELVLLRAQAAAQQQPRSSAPRRPTIVRSGPATLKPSPVRINGLKLWPVRSWPLARLTSILPWLL